MCWTEPFHFNLESLSLPSLLKTNSLVLTKRQKKTLYGNSNQREKATATLETERSKWYRRE